MRAIIRYPGSKWGLADWIISHFPENYDKMVYLEPFCGSGAVFFNKIPGAVETVNDLDGDIVNLYRVLRDNPEELKRVLSLTPYSREEYDLSFEPCEDPVERARRYMVKTTQAIGAKMDGKCGAAAKRLRGDTTHLVQIEHMDAMRLIERYDNPDVLMYLDPPYVLCSRRGGRLYRHEMDDDGHKKLMELITNSRAKIVLSGYQSDIYNDALQGWHKDTIQSQVTSADKATEIIWQNFDPPAEQLTF